MHSLSDVFFRVAVAVAVGRRSKLTHLIVFYFPLIAEQNV